MLLMEVSVFINCLWRFPLWYNAWVEGLEACAVVILIFRGEFTYYILLLDDAYLGELTLFTLETLLSSLAVLIVVLFSFENIKLLLLLNDCLGDVAGSFKTGLLACSLAEVIWVILVLFVWCACDIAYWF